MKFIDSHHASWFSIILSGMAGALVAYSGKFFSWRTLIILVSFAVADIVIEHIVDKIKDKKNG